MFLHGRPLLPPRTRLSSPHLPRNITVTMICDPFRSAVAYSPHYPIWRQISLLPIASRFSSTSDLDVYTSPRYKSLKLNWATPWCSFSVTFTRYNICLSCCHRHLYFFRLQELAAVAIIMYGYGRRNSSHSVSFAFTAVFFPESSLLWYKLPHSMGTGFILLIQEQKTSITLAGVSLKKVTASLVVA